MALFGKKNAKNNLSTMETVDFSNDTWSYKGDVPSYQIQSDGFTYDIQDADGNEKNAICLGLLGMLIIVLNAKSPKIKEDELLPLFSKVIKTRNWHTMTVKEANFLSQTAIKKLGSSSMSGDVFDLASYAPLEIKRVLLKQLFSISRTMMKVEFRENAEHRIIDDIVPEIFANPDYELALLTGLIVKAEPKPEKSVAAAKPRRVIQHQAEVEENEEAPELQFAPESKVAVESMPEPEPMPVPAPILSQPEPAAEQQPEPVPVPEPPVREEPAAGSAFDELQRLYGRRSDSIRAQAKPYGLTQQPTQSPELPVSSPTSQSASDFAAPQPNNPFSAESQSFDFGSQSAAYAQNVDPSGYSQNNGADFAAPQPNNPFTAVPQPGSVSQNFDIPRPSMPDFNMPGTYTQMGPGLRGGAMQQAAPNYNIPQPPMPNYGMGQMNYPQNPYNQQQNAAMQNGAAQAQNPNFAWQQGNMPYGQGYPQQNNNMMNNGWQQYPPQNMWQNMPQGYPQQPGYNAQNMPNPQGWQNNPQQNQNSSRS